MTYFRLSLHGAAFGREDLDLGLYEGDTLMEAISSFIEARAAELPEGAQMLLRHNIIATAQDDKKIATEVMWLKRAREFELAPGSEFALSQAMGLVQLSRKYVLDDGIRREFLQVAVQLLQGSMRPETNFYGMDSPSNDHAMRALHEMRMRNRGQ